MDRSEAERIVKRDINGLMLKLGIPHWEIVVCFDRFDDDRPDVRGMVTHNVDYNRATVQIDPKKCDDEQDLLSVLRHELYHVVLSPFQLVERALLALVKGDDRLGEVVRDLNVHANESAVKNLGRMFYGLTHRPEECRFRSPTPESPAVKTKPKPPSKPKPKPKGK